VLEELCLQDQIEFWKLIKAQSASKSASGFKGFHGCLRLFTGVTNSLFGHVTNPPLPALFRREEDNLSGTIQVKTSTARPFPTPALRSGTPVPAISSLEGQRDRDSESIPARPGS
jgi:hypothetical protein